VPRPELHLRVRGVREMSYNSMWGDGFVAAYETSARGCASAAECGGHECGSDGLCRCAPGSYGADCSAVEHCVGTSSSSAVVGEFTSSAEALEPWTLYPNQAHCVFVNTVGGHAFVRYRVAYDLEDTFDYVQFYAGAAGAAHAHVRLTGWGEANVTVPVMNGRASLRFTSDNKGRRWRRRCSSARTHGVLSEGWLARRVAGRASGRRGRRRRACATRTATARGTAVAAEAAAAARLGGTV
jgi:hypothetical protein